MEQVIKAYHDSILLVRALFEDVRFNRELDIVRINQHAKNLMEIVQSNRNFYTLLQHLKNLDLYYYTHPVAVAIIAGRLGKWLNLDEHNIYKLVFAGLLHDIGKAKIPDSILNKSTELTDREYEIVKEHTSKGYELLSKQIDDKDILLAIKQHHERSDGSGYPEGLKEQEIHTNAKIIAVADIFDAMTSNRKHSTRRPMHQVVKEIYSGSYGILDPIITHVFLKSLEEFSIGAKVLLSNQVIGEIVYVNPTSMNRPVVRSGGEYIDLSKKSDLKIVEFF
ncbi:HD-GYP domain-containing protein [Desulfuribacillus alkaliarsenatis]|uniref:Uncharacterized protein n=1 Tax=Desulfuribacillus alkaliarsenatis TaxID=766136 RepID=A0A1E5G2U3_9FIRM|nr:HD-GYP domain-containing protein [Desulfuribacillus alkaliarsenatis]OEF97405.1 hypothetical protein BHF68_04140 [Desulfuribacillus alkaliarsenatis]